MRKQRRSAGTATLDYRTFRVEKTPGSLREQDRTVDGDIATEQPVTEFDWDRWEWIPRVLLASGAEWPAQIPLLDTHRRGSIESQLGSIRELHVADRRVRGTLHFSSRSEDAYTKVREGHVTDLSVGFVVLEQIHVPDGQKQTIDGRTFEGPINVAVRWRAHEASLCPIGADDQCKLRGLDASILTRLNQPQGETTMKLTKEERAALVAQGMPANATDEQAEAWVKQRVLTPAPAPEPERKAADPAPTPAPAPAPPAAGNDGARADAGTLTQETVQRLVAEGARAALEEQRKQDEAKRTMIRAEADSLCEIAGVPELAARLYACETVADLRAKLKEYKADTNAPLPWLGPGALRQADSQPRDDFRKDVATALVMRTFRQQNISKPTQEEVLPVAERGKGADRWQHAGLMDLAEECALMDGSFRDRQSMRQFAPWQIASAAIGFAEQVGVRDGGSGLNVTSMFSLITQDAINKDLRAGYTEYPSTWKICFREGSPARDFKTLHRIRLSETQNMPVWPDNQAPWETSMSDLDETYAIEAFALALSLSWRLVVNDDLDALSRGPTQLGRSAARTVDATAWAPIMANGLMADGQALFSGVAGNRLQSNNNTGAGAKPTSTNIATLSTKMLTTRGLNTRENKLSDAILGIQPKYLVVPAALKQEAIVETRSPFDRSATNSATYNTSGDLEPVVVPLLDANSATAWYLLGNQSDWDTIEVTFLAGQSMPVTNSWIDPKTLARNWNIIQCFGAKALDWRAMQRHTGA